jgi:hypothetical protein
MLCRSCCSTCVYSMVFIDLKVDFEYTMMQENAMYFDEVQYATVCLKSTMTLLASFFSLV